MGIEPLICATCAEERQTPHEYHETIWSPNYDGSYSGTMTNKLLPLPKWSVDENGQVPSYQGPGPDGCNHSMTYKLIINLKDDGEKQSMVPAIPDESMDNGIAGVTHQVSEEGFKWWAELPTR